MDKLGFSDFPAYFQALWDKPPFAWQQALAERVIQGHPAPIFEGVESNSTWPQAIALPTAAGKTACLDIAVFALALQAQNMVRGEPVTAPRRIFFVVDRRAIVDEAYERARCLAERLTLAQDGILLNVANNLRLIARGETDGFASETPLAVFALRGGMYRSEAWARSPLQPTIVASTVDQLGSRLLFRAYGRGPGMWPIYAALAANDSLILLDEAHCAQPMLQTLQAVSRYREWAEQPLKRCFNAVVMSATPPAGLETFEDASGQGQDPAHPLGRRQLAAKPTQLREVSKAKGAKAISILSKELVKAAKTLAGDQPKAVVIFVNRVATARATHRLLSRDTSCDTTLLTGRMRPVDKDQVVGDTLSLLASAKSSYRQLDKPHFVVATQTLEVGADLDFDALVTECASLDALRQRFGRLNRMGRSIDTHAILLIQGGQAQKSDDDPVYGPALAKTWQWLKRQADDEDRIDFGIRSLAERLPVEDEMSSLNAPARNAAVMLPAHLDCWAQTAPQPVPSPDPAPFLHGPHEGAADVHVCWRADLDLETPEGQQQALDILSLCPPTAAETLAVPIGSFKRWLASEPDDEQEADIEGVNANPVTIEDRNTTDKKPHFPQVPVIIWAGRETRVDSHITNKPGRIRPGSLIVISTNSQHASRLGDLPPKYHRNPHRLDVGDLAYLKSRAKPLLRLHPDLIAMWDDAAPKTQALEVLGKLPQRMEDDPDALLQEVRDLVGAIAGTRDSLPDAWRWLAHVGEALSLDFRKRATQPAMHLIGKQELILVGRRLLKEYTQEAGLFSDEDDNCSSGTSYRNGQPVKLFDHLPGAATLAERYARGCGLHKDMIHALSLAGLLHDLGKADPRFQALLRGGNRWLSSKTLLAKSGDMRQGWAAETEARVVSGYPQGGRHELLSVRLAESLDGLLPSDNEYRDLVLHLIASHHGHCRPFAPVVEDTDPKTVRVAFPDALDRHPSFKGQSLSWSGPTEMERLDSGVPDRFWRLLRRYGWWGLAWLEALLRLADHRQSEWEEKHAPEDKHE